MAFLVWCGLALAVGVKAIASPTRHTVWPVFATASTHWFAGESLYKYYPGLDMYRYSPTFAVAVTPLAVLPNRIGGCLWGIGSLALLYAGLRALHRDVLADRHAPASQGAFLLLAALGVAPMMWNLQSNGLLLALIAFGTAAAARGRWWPAAWLLAAPVFIKLWPLAWVGVVAASRPRQLGPRLLVAMVGLAALPELAAKPEFVAQTYDEWASILVAGQGLRWPGYRDLLTICQVVGLHVDQLVYRAVQAGAGCGVLLATLIVTRRTGDSRQGLKVGLAAWLCWQLLLGPGSEMNTYGLIVPLMGWEAIRSRQAGGAWWWPGAMLVVVLLFMSGDFERSVGRWLPVAPAVLPTMVAGFVCWLVVARPQRDRQKAPVTIDLRKGRYPLSRLSEIHSGAVAELVPPTGPPGDGLKPAHEAVSSKLG